MYRFTKKQLKELGDKGWNIVKCSSEDQAQQVQQTIKASGFNARCGCIRTDSKELITFVVTNRPIKEK